MKNFILLFIAATLSFYTGLAAGVNPFVTSVSGVALMSLSVSPQGSLRDGIDISEVAVQLGDYFRMYSREIWSQILKGINFEQYMKTVTGVTSQHVGTVSSRTEFIQAYQKGFQPKGTVSLVPYINQVFKLKIDYLIEDLPQLSKNYLAFLYAENKSVDQYPFVQWVVETHLIPGMTEEMYRNAVIGNRVNPTTGVAGNSVDSLNGIFTIITDEIAAGNLTNVIATGALTTSNIVDKVEDFHKAIDFEYRSLPGIVFMSDAWAQAYKYGYRDNFGTNQDFTGATMSIFGTQKQIVGIPALNGSSRMMYTPTGPQGNMLKLQDKVSMPTLTSQVYNRELKLLGDFHRGYGFESLEAVFVNDQA